MNTSFHRLDDHDQTQVWVSAEAGLPRLLYWGDPLPGDCDLHALEQALRPALPHGGLDVAEEVSWLPEPGRGFTDEPGLALRRGSRHLYTRFGLQAAQSTEAGWSFHLRDPGAALALQLHIELHGPSGVLSARCQLTNEGADALSVDALASLALPVPRRLRERLSLTGRWAAEFQAVREPVGRAAWMQEARGGRTSHHAFPGLVLMEPGTHATQGEAWSLQLAWSGNHRLLVQALRGGGLQVQAAGLLLPGEVTLQPGESYASPTVHLCRSAAGLRPLSLRWHRFVRERVLPPLREHRRVQLNSWEAAYLDHDCLRMQALARRAAALGVERFVLDDGWFAGRRDDRAGLGNWEPCPERYPQGLAPLAACCQALGMQFGLWVEPEGVSPGSALHREHPQWILGVPGLEQPLGRNQYVLNLGLDAAREHLFHALGTLLRSAPIHFLKWDMNRDMTHAAGPGRVPAARQHVLGLYRLLDDLRQAFPWLEIETCASGGARADLGILQRTRRIWVSDCNDPLERQRMHRALLTFLPAEIMGVHVGARRSHTTGRHADIALRTLTALLGHPGIEADPIGFSEEEASHLRQAIAFYKAERAWLAQAEVTAVDHEDPAVLATSAIASDGRRALVTVVAVDRTADAVPGPLRVPGLVAQGRYRVGLHPLWPADPRHGKLPAGPFQFEDCLTLDGRVLRDAGLALPILLPGTGVLLVLDQIE